MKTTEFYNEFQPISIRAMQLFHNYRELSPSKRAQESVSIQQDMNKVFGDAGFDSMMGKNVNITI